ncbi:MAG: hypothetical protein ABI165_12440 [Bryobacteraceae bacterium]
MKSVLALLSALSLLIVPGSAAITHGGGPVDQALQRNKKNKKPKKQKPAHWGHPKNR